MDDTECGGSQILKSLDIANDAIMTAISAYRNMLNFKTEVNRLLAEHKRIYNKNYSLRDFATARRSITFRTIKVIENISELGQVYKSLIKFALNDIRKLAEIGSHTRWASN